MKLTADLEREVARLFAAVAPPRQPDVQAECCAEADLPPELDAPADHPWLDHAAVVAAVLVPCAGFFGAAP